MSRVATGVGEVQSSDMNGDGKADYLWITKDRTIISYLRGGSGSNSWLCEPQGIIAKAIGAPRQDIKFADLNGDGLADCG
jgi:hypothetical protein